MMRKLLLCFLGSAVLWMSACGVAEKQEVRTGLDASIEQLPESKDFDMISITRYYDSMTVYGDTCFYGTAYVLVGTSLSEVEALDAYSDELLKAEWISDGEQYAHEYTLLHGDQEMINVSDYEPYDFSDYEGYLEAKDDYMSFLFIRLVFYVPARDGC
jgi:hypothetical protein